MKKVLLFLASVLLFSACANKLPKDAVLKGILTNKPDFFGLLTSKGLTDTITINEDGTFRFQKSISAPSYFTFKVGRVAHSVYLSPGDSLVLNLDMETRSNDPVFSGSIASENDYLLKANKISRGLTTDFRGLFSKPYDTFIGKVDSVKNEILSLLANERIDNKQFVANEKERLFYYTKRMMFEYPGYNARFMGKDFNPDSADFSFMNDVDLNLTRNLHINEYSSLVNDYIQTLHWSCLNKPENKGKSRFELNIMLFDLIDSLIPSPEIRDFVKHQSVVETIQWEKFEDAKNLYEHFIKNATIESYKTIATNVYNSRMLLAPGTDAPAFSLTGIDGLTYSLSDFKGKLVYIDFWASWCSPCRAEIPSLLTLKETYKDKPVAFVAISLDDDIEAWKNMVAEKQLKGYQLHAENAWSSDVAKKYQIKGVPTFVLIDGAGKIIEYNVARPSDPEISLILDRNLKTL